MKRLLFISLKVMLDLLIGVFTSLFVIRVSGNQSLEYLSIGAPLAAVITVFSVTVRVLVSRFVRQKLSSNPDESSKQSLPNQAFMTNAEEQFQTNLGVDLVATLTATIINPAGYFDRISESVEIHTSRYMRTTTLTLRCAGKRTLIPLLAQKKHVLIDGLEVSIGGKAAATLPYMENQGAVLWVVDSLFESLAAQAADRTGFTADILLGLKQVVAAPNEVESTDEIAGLEKCAKAQNLVDTPEFQSLSAIVEFGASAYFIFGLVERSADYSTTVVIASSFARTPGGKTGVGILRVALGLRRRDHLFTMSRAAETISYHFAVRTPRGMYVHEQALNYHDVTPKDAPPALPGERRSLTPPESRRNRSPKLVHVYLRDHVSLNGASVPALRLNLRERPPGILEVCWILSLGLCIIVWIVGANHDQIFMVAQSSTTNPASGQVVTTMSRPASWPTLLFGIPTLLTGWLVSRIDAAVMARISLWTLFSCSWLTVNAALSITAAAFKSSGLEATEEPFTHVGIQSGHPIWAVLMVSCLLHAAFTGLSSVSRSLRFAAVSNNLTDNSRPEHNEKVNK